MVGVACGGKGLEEMGLQRIWETSLSCTRFIAQLAFHPHPRPQFSLEIIKGMCALQYMYNDPFGRLPEVFDWPIF